MKLEKLMDSLEKFEINRESIPDIDILDIHFNSQEITKSSIFVAIKGHLTDGHKYIDNAIQNGAVVVVVEEFVNNSEVFQIKVSNTREALADLSAEFFGNPSRDLNLIGITATNGKTTTSFMTKAIFDEHKINSGIIGTVAVKYNDVNIPSILTTPESRDLQMHMHNMVEQDISDVIMEVSSHAMEMGRIRNLDYNIVTFNNLSREHIDQHGSFENYYAIKSTLVKKAGENAIAILNYDYDKIKCLSDQTKAKVFAYSLEKPLEYDFGIDNIDLSTGYATFDFIINHDLPEYNISKGSYAFELGIAGYSSVMNAMVAIIISLLRGIPIETITKALKDFKGVERRFQVIYDEEIKIVDDHYANVNNIDVTMNTINQMDFNQFKMLYAIRGNRGVNLNHECALDTVKWLKEIGVDTIYSTSSVETVSAKDEVLKEEKAIFDQVMAENNIKVIHHDRLDDAIYNMLNIVEKDDLLLLAGCQGMDAGGRILLEEKSKNLSEEERQKMLKVLDGRAF